MSAQPEIPAEDCVSIEIDGRPAEVSAGTSILRAARESRGAIDFESTETRIVFGSERKIERIVPLVRNDAHKLIEECMIAANVASISSKVRTPICDAGPEPT
mgnify:CR=1 FL=1